MDFTNGDWRRQVERTQHKKGDKMSDEKTIAKAGAEFDEAKKALLEETISVGDKLSIEGLGEYVVREVPPAYNDLRNAMQDAEGIERSSYVGLDTALAAKLNFLILTDNTEYSECPPGMIAETFELSGNLIRYVSLIIHETDNLNASRGNEEVSKIIIIQATEFSREFFAKIYYMLHQLEYHYRVRFRGEDFDPSVPVEINGACEPFTVQRSKERVAYSAMLFEDFGECIYDLMFGKGLLESNSSDNLDIVLNAKRIMGHLASSLHLDLGKEVGLFCDWAMNNRFESHEAMRKAQEEEEKILDDMVLANDSLSSSAEDSLIRDDLGDGMEFPEDGSELDLDDVP